jgi:hypothetical protein
MMLTDEHIQNFWAKVSVRGKDECWEWRGARQSKGYGSFSIGGKTYLAHRISWMLVNGRMPLEYLQVLHSCDNPPCCNPNHLREGTCLENVHDMISKGRANTSGLKHSGNS